MPQLSSLLHGMASWSLSLRKDDHHHKMINGKADGGGATSKSAMMMLRSSGTLHDEFSNCFASACSRRGDKGLNQDSLIVSQGVGGQELGTLFCGIFDGHGPWGHYVAKAVRDALLLSLITNYQEAVALASLLDGVQKLPQLDHWKRSWLIACATVDKELERHRGFDAFHSGTTVLSVVKQGDLLVIANVGDSRAVLATTSDDGALVPVQLTVDFKPGIPQEAERIRRCNGRVFSLSDEPGVLRVWLPKKEAPGLAVSRAFGDYCLKAHGVTSVPDVKPWKITAGKDRFIILATDGVWDVVSNEEAVQVVSSAKLDRAKSAKQLVDFAVRAWRHKRKGHAVDDCTVVCLFFDS